MNPPESLDKVSVKKSEGLEQTLLASPKIREKVKDDAYAQKLYHSLCNTRWIKNDFLSKLRQHPEKDFWSCSWRYAGGVVADLREEGDYMDWYCSGNEGMIDPEVAADLLELGWVGIDDNDRWV